MQHNASRVGRRAVLAALLAAPVAACAPRTQAAAPAPALGPDPELVELERRYDARLGLFARNTATGRTLSHRADERVALCSTFKVYASAALLRAHGLAGGYFERVIRYDAGQLVEYSPITEGRVGTGMTVGELCAAALQHSDNTAANLLLRELGGPQAITEFARSIGDPATRLDRWEVELNTAIPGDERDTSSPRALADGLQRLLLGDALGAAERDRLTAWMLGNTTGDARIRAGVPRGWRTADKTGGGSAYGVANDIAVTWTETGTPIVLSLLTSRPREDDTANNALLADATRLVVSRIA
ncbi:class A beta-lactamase [Saccharopolyspora rhizosphaerae]|uniref:Beta-lactamase n=1 Tax=Saccharopolyspora rhizosphaerae TaxID=2492662 RepID=A0A426JWF2_9PSEU|nr:class A beta-lactamase [Saccharopolyspora rhizosphaerae]RRO17496.1 class A beta-lactamase [Saccharopolyspora rhizosphaerae]